MNCAQRRAGEVAVLVVDRLDAGSVDRQQLAAVEVEPPAQQHELAEHRFEGAAIVASEVGDRLEVGLQAAQQPDDLDIALGFPLQPPARSDPVQIAVDVELQQIAGRIARPPRRFRLDPREPGRRKVEPINEGVDEPNRIVGVDVIVQPPPATTRSARCVHIKTTSRRTSQAYARDLFLRYR